MRDRGVLEQHARQCICRDPQSLAGNQDNPVHRLNGTNEQLSLSLDQPRTVLRRCDVSYPMNPVMARSSSSHASRRCLVS